ncbi:MAG: DUF1737 domain-containing protein [Paludibacter sp.]|nr:DUF1737 domain-containing protein [Paludibacter sp.]
MIDYDIVEAQNASDLKEKVVFRIETGWVPIGGVSIFKNGDRVTYSQALTKTSRDLKAEEESEKVKELINLLLEHFKQSNQGS